MKVQGNIFKMPDADNDQQEDFEILFESSKIKIERIITHKQFQEPGEWYDQEQDEWVVLLKGEAELEFKDDKRCKLFSGDFIFIPAHKTHRVRQTNGEHPCLWLAFHGKLK